MDISHLIISFISPYLPYLLKSDKEITKGTDENPVEKFGESTWQKAEQVWAKLFPKLKSKPLVWDALESLADAPKDEDMIHVLVKQLQKLLQDDQSLSEELHNLLRQQDVIAATSITQSVTGDRNIVIGESI